MKTYDLDEVMTVLLSVPADRWSEVAVALAERDPVVAGTLAFSIESELLDTDYRAAIYAPGMPPVMELA